MKNAIRLIVSLGLSVLFLWLAFKNVDFKSMMKQLVQVKLGYVALYTLMLVVIQFARALRWDVLIRPFAKLSFSATLRISNFGNMLIMLLPLRLGEFGRPYLVKKESGAPMSAGIGAVVMERVIDGLLVTLLFYLTTVVMGDQYAVPSQLRTAALLALGIFSAATLVIAVALLTHGWVPQVLRKIGTPISAGITEKLVGMLEAFVSGLRSFPDMKTAFVVIGWTLLYWAANALGLWWLSVGFGWDLPVVAGFAIVSVVVIGIMLPAGPGFLGTYQLAIMWGLSIFGIDENRASAYGLIAYVLNLGVVVGFGLPYVLGRNHLDMSEIVSASNEEAAHQQ